MGFMQALQEVSGLCELRLMGWSGTVRGWLVEIGVLVLPWPSLAHPQLGSGTQADNLALACKLGWLLWPKGSSEQLSWSKIAGYHPCFFITSTHFPHAFSMFFLLSTLFYSLLLLDWTIILWLACFYILESKSTMSIGLFAASLLISLI